MIYGRVHAAAKSRPVRIIANAVAKKDSFLYDVCQQNQSTIGSPNIKNLCLFRTAIEAVLSSFGVMSDTSSVFIQKMTDEGCHTSPLPAFRLRNRPSLSKCLHPSRPSGCI